ncbi:hypothetical protein [Polyangium jinanense]|uniref:Uncharacterized protein n=1 Tax=Polyangium jinanense TaxID=2829994 RepID=A0A9X3WYZ4_9BACT|nr:hypothetical protein [Polyangium jinanense]MDC3979810.1 hypothetical protein [Polyangium jinanense]
MTSDSERLSTAIQLTDGAMAMDGGSLVLHAVDQDGARVELFLDWSIRSHQEGKTQFYANGQPVPRGSPEEARWLSLIGGAVPKPSNSRPTPEEKGRAGKTVILAEDAAGYFNAIEKGPASALAHLANRFVSLISSQAYKEARAPAPPQAPEDRVESLLREGKTMAAIQAFREAHPHIGLEAASRAVKAMAAEMEEATLRR